MSRHTYPGGVYKWYKSLWEELNNEGVDYTDVFSDDDKRKCRNVPHVGHLCTWDLEAKSLTR